MEKNIGMQKRLRNVIGVIIALFCLGYPLYSLSKGFFKWQFQTTDYKMMLLELLVWFLIAMLGIKRANILWLIVELTIFTYLHMMFLPVSAAIIYALLTEKIGNTIYKFYIKKEEKNKNIISYFLGVMVLTILYAILSFFNLGSIKNLIRLNVFFLIILCANALRKHRFMRVDKRKMKVSRSEYLISAVIMCFLMLAIGRANISLDYDSVWYGLRSAFVLDNQGGIYDNLKLVGCVNIYAKGLETYLLPLSGTDSYGFFYAANILFGCLVLLMVYKICKMFLKRKQALLGVMFTAMVPGIMNMTITAKTDIMTLFIQLLCVYFVINYINEKKPIYLGMIISTYVYSQTLKPTSVIFSTSIILAFVCVCICYRVNAKIDKSTIILACISAIDLLLIWMRTYWLTGIPASSVWGRIFRKLGFTDKYPYSSSQISQFRSGNIFSKDVINATIKRIWEFCFAPQSQDMDHVIIAWGTTLCTFLLIIICVCVICNIHFFYDKLKARAVYGFIGLFFVGEALGCILSLWLLIKPDGNYFMLYYVITIVLGVIFIFKYIFERKKLYNVVFYTVIAGFAIENMAFTGAVNWAWASSFSNINWLNKGYYNHKEEFKTKMNERGCVEIYNIMCDNPHNKVLAFGTHPEVERFPCVIESELDVTYWGNSELFANIESFVEYIQFAGYKYIYIEPGYLDDKVLYQDYITFMKKEKNIEEVYEENGYILFETKFEA